jgi:hypothetical protein
VAFVQAGSAWLEIFPSQLFVFVVMLTAEVKNTSVYTYLYMYLYIYAYINISVYISIYKTIEIYVSVWLQIFPSQLFVFVVMLTVEVRYDGNNM